MADARKTTRINKAPGRRASDAGRSRLGDLTRPVAREQRIAPRRRTALIFGVVALVVAGSIGAALFGLPVRTWFEQDVAQRRLDEQLHVLQTTNAELGREVDRLQTPAGATEAAREELGFIGPHQDRDTMSALPDLPPLPKGWPYSVVRDLMELQTEGS